MEPLCVLSESQWERQAWFWLILLCSEPWKLLAPWDSLGFSFGVRVWALPGGTQDPFAPGSSPGITPGRLRESHGMPGVKPGLSWVGHL